MKRNLAPLAAILILAGCGNSNDPVVAGTGSASSKVVAKLIGAGSEPKTQLRLKMSKGDLYEFVTSDETQVDDSGQGKYVTKSSQTASTRVVEAGGGTFKVELSTKDFNVEVTGNEMLKSMVPKIVESVESVKMSASFTDRGAPIKTAFSSGDAMTGMIGNAIANMDMGFQGMVYPDQAVGAGAIWTAEIDLGKGLEGTGMLEDITGGKVPIRYELVEIDAGKKEARIRYSFDATITAKVKEVPDSVTSKMSMSGEVKVNLTNGIPVESAASGTTENSGSGHWTSQKMKVSISLKR